MEQSNTSHKRPHSPASSASLSDRPPRKVAGLVTVPLSLTKEQHEEMDQQVLDVHLEEVLDGRRPSFLLAAIVDNAPNLLDSNYAVESRARVLVEGDIHLRKELRDAWANRNKQGFARIRSFKILHPRSTTHPILASHTQDDMAMQLRATVASWKTPYVPGAEQSFLHVINNRFRDKTAKTYANHVAVVQSSGTGKSRMLHEASSLVFSVVMNFGNDGATGYPQPDVRVRDYLTKGTSLRQIEEQVTCFLIALFDCLSSKKMATPHELQKLLGYGDPLQKAARTAFFDDVINTALKMPVQRASTPGPEDSPGIPSVKTADGHIRYLQDAAKELCENLPKMDGVRFILGFDEASEMTKAPAGFSDNVYTHIRRVLRALRDYPIYSAFMSTTGSFRQFHPSRGEDNSRRLYEGVLNLWPPYTLVGFDQLATALQEGATLDDATEIQFLLGLGRPLFKSRYNSGNKEIKDSIVDFAMRKLLNGHAEDDIGCKLAPLVMRLPLAFNSLTHQGRQAEHKQVESHMRICLNIVPEADVMYTVAPSEPVLIEAATQIMVRQDKIKPGTSVGELQRFLSNRYLSKGDRGELACMLLMLLARDRVCSSLPDSDSVPKMPYHTPMLVTDFLKALFPAQHHVKILSSKSTVEGETLEEMFSDSWLHFTHFVKVTDHKVVDRKFLLRMMSRGAAVLCADNHLGIDGLMPTSHKTKKLTLESQTSILVQIKNVAENVSSALFKNMEPQNVGVFDKNLKDHPPVIKLILSVGSDSNFVSCTAAKTTRNTRSPALPAQFQIFASGLSHKTFSPINVLDEPTWRELVSRSGVEDIYGGQGGGGDVSASVLRRMMPCAESDPNHWASFFPL